MSEIACPACGAANSDLNPRCLRCGASLPEESRRPVAAANPGLADTVPSPIAATIPAAPPSPDVESHPGAKLGRFTVLEELGRGSMGMVVRAHDPALDRTVAIKVLRPEALGMLGAAEARERLLREAKAMAKVSHRNAVNVHEVDVAGEQVLVVMEYIRGRSLRAWLREEPRSQQQILDVFLQAGRGLAEVHRTGFVHRDFKPDNVLVGTDGRACVTDFGLAGLVGEPAGGGRDRVDSQAITAPGMAIPEVTRTGALVGTPTYMAPEQHQLQRADARADQFAFCVSLYEALYGQRPFAGKVYEEIRASVMAGTVQPAPEGAAVPARLRRIVLRGLAVKPGDRYPSMALLLADLEKDPRAARRRALLGVAAGGLVAIAAFGVVRGATSGASLCRGGAERLAGVWDTPAKAGVEKAFLATGKPYAGDTFRRVERILDERATAWVAMYRDSCEATHMRGEQSEQLLDARTGCLERRRTELSALAALLASEPSADVLNRAVEAAYALPGLDACANRDSLLAPVPLPADPTAIRRIAAAHAALAKAAAQLQTQRFQEGLETTRSIEGEVRAAGHAPLVAEWLFIRGALERETGDYSAAEETLRSAAVEAARAKNDALLVEIWTDEIEVVGLRRARYAEALALEAAALGTVERAGGDPSLRGKLLANLAQVMNKKGERARAVENVQSAVKLLEKAPGGEGPDLALALTFQGSILFALRRMDEALASYERSLQIRERLFGESHRTVASSLNGLAMVYGTKGENEEALARSRRAADIVERVLGPAHPTVADMLSNLALILTDLGRYEEAFQTHHRVLAIREKALDPDHPSVAACLHNMAYSLQAQGRHAEARPYLERALVIREKVNGPKHQGVALELSSLGFALCGMGQLQAGVERLRRAMAIYQELGEKDGPDMANVLVQLAECLQRAGQIAEARSQLERALSIATARTGDLDHGQVAEAEFMLARALWSAPADRKRAVKLATSARDRFARLGGRYGKDVALVDAWMKDHAPGAP